MTNQIIASWIINDNASTKSSFPQIGRLGSDTRAAHEIYWRCVATFFACARRTASPNQQLVLFSNSADLPSAIKEQLRRWDVQLVLVPLRHLPPDDYHSAWRNQFYILDIIQYLVTNKLGSMYLILDCDCLIIRQLTSLFYDLVDRGALVYTVHYETNAKINGLTREELKTIHEILLGRMLNFVPEYYGGEFFAVTHRMLQLVAEEAEVVWQDCLTRFREGRKKFNEEAQLLSYIYLKLGITQDSASQFIKRLWTGPRIRNVHVGDLDLCIWHLPAEKKHGLKQLSKAVFDDSSWFWRLPVSEVWRKRIGDLVGVPRLTVRKALGDSLQKLWTAPSVVLSGYSLRAAGRK